MAGQEHSLNFPNEQELLLSLCSSVLLLYRARARYWPRHLQSSDAAATTAALAADVYYQNCDAVRAAGAAPIYVGDPGYRPGLDRDGDGVGCE